MPSDRRVVALVGLSGVGKSTLLRRISEFMEFEHLEASRLIRAELQRDKLGKTSEELRNSDISQNQRLLILGFRRATYGKSGLFVLDAHLMIDTDRGLIEIPEEVFAELGIELFCFLQARPEKILERRATDDQRSRPIRSLDDLTSQQDRALLLLGRHARSLEIPAILITAEEEQLLANILRNMHPAKDLGTA